MPQRGRNPLLVSGLRNLVCYSVKPRYRGKQQEWQFYAASNGRVARLDVPLDRGDRPMAPEQLEWFQKRHCRDLGATRTRHGDGWELSSREVLDDLHKRLLRVGDVVSWDFMTTRARRAAERAISVVSGVPCELSCMWGMDYLPGLRKGRTHFCKIPLESSSPGRYFITCVVYRKRATKVHPSEWFCGLFDPRTPQAPQTEFPTYKPVPMYEIDDDQCREVVREICRLPQGMFAWFRGRCVFEAGTNSAS